MCVREREREREILVAIACLYGVSPFTKVHLDQILLFYLIGEYFFNILKTDTYSVFFN